MPISARNRSGVTILDVKGAITIGKGDIALRKAVQEALEAGSRKLLINMQGVTTIDSSGLGELISIHTSMSNRGGKLALENLPSKVLDILQITQLITVVAVYDDEDEAISELSG